MPYLFSTRHGKYISFHSGFQVIALFPNFVYFYIVKCSFLLEHSRQEEAANKFSTSSLGCAPEFFRFIYKLLSYLSFLEYNGCCNNVFIGKIIAEKGPLNLEVAPRSWIRPKCISWCQLSGLRFLLNLSIWRSRTSPWQVDVPAHTDRYRGVHDL